MITVEPVELDANWWGCDLIDVHGNRWEIGAEHSTPDGVVLLAYEILEAGGKQAFEMYSIVRGELSPPWESLGDKIKEAWSLSAFSIKSGMLPCYMEPSP